jgi:hypothetical protein
MMDKKKKLSEKEMRRLAKALTFGSRYGSRMPMGTVVTTITLIDQLQEKIQKEGQQWQG